ncbi:MAG: hypothetical protein MJZ42_04450 [Bacteroidales bacterium]|nr:hypothetical protein [Bacteroidales bacterium]
MKNIYLLLLLLIVAFGARAQNGSFCEKSYVSVGAGGLYYLNDGNNFSHRWGYSGECTYGVNIFQRVGFRIQGFADHVYNPIDNPHFYFGAHFDLTLNLMRCFGGYRAALNNELAPFLGFGALERHKTAEEGRDLELFVCPGIYYSHRIYNDILLQIEAKAKLMPWGFDHSDNLSSFFSITAGVMHRFSNQPYQTDRVISHIEATKNWYMSLSAGMTSFQYADNFSFSQRMTMLKPMAEFSVGHYVSSTVGLRAVLGFCQGQTRTTSFNVLTAHGDIMLNITNMIRYQQNRQWNFSVYGGAGLMGRFGDNIAGISLDLGALTRLWLSLSSDIYLDLRYTAVPSRFANMPGQSAISVGFLSAQLGYCYNINIGTHR